MSEANGQRRRITEIARTFIAQNAIILDTETTGLGDDSQIVEIAIVDATETLEFSALVKPLKPVPPEAAAVHGITTEMAASGLDWKLAWQITRDLIHDRDLLAYNSEFDARMIKQTCIAFDRDRDYLEWDCLMNMWSEFHGLRRWQRLENVCYQIGVQPGGHRALGDAKAAREVLRWLARQEVSTNV